MKNRDNIVINNMPAFNTWLVIAYGALVKVKNESGVPNAQVVIRKLKLINNVWCQTDTDEIVYIPVTELDIVKIGSVWKEKKLIYTCTDYTHLIYQKDKIFDFDLTNISNMEVIQYDQHIKELKSSIKDIYTINLDKHDKRSQIINKSLYTKLIDANNNIILIPSLELFTASYTPYHKEIRTRLLQQDFDSALNKYINDGKSYYDYAKHQYVITIIDTMHEDNITFIAYAKFNNITRVRLNKLWNSLEYDLGDKDSSYSVRYPYVLPYNPSHLKLECNGVWLNDNVFLVLKVCNKNLPIDLSLKVKVQNSSTQITTNYIGPKNKNDDKNEPQVKENQTNIDTNIIDSNSTPHIKNITQQIRSEVGTIGPLPHFEYEYETLELQVTKNEIDNGLSFTESKNQSEAIDDYKEINLEQLSSAQANSCESSSTTAKLLMVADCNKDSAILFESVIRALETLKADTKSNIKDFVLLNEKFEPCSSTNTNFYTTLYESIKNDDIKNSWLRLKKRGNKGLEWMGYRSYLLVKVYLYNQKICYLLEIGKKDTEHFSGLLFNNRLKEKFQFNDFIELLKKIVSNDGTNLVNILSMPEMEKEFYSYKHKYNPATKEYIGLASSIKNKIKLI
jgi:hypothetical protein